MSTLSARRPIFDSLHPFIVVALTGYCLGSYYIIFRGSRWMIEFFAQFLMRS